MDPPTAQARSQTVLRLPTAACGCCTGSASSGSGAPMKMDFASGSLKALGSSSRWTPTVRIAPGTWTPSSTQRADVAAWRLDRDTSAAATSWAGRRTACCSRRAPTCTAGRVRDCTSGFRCYTRALLEAIRLDEVVSQGYSFQIEMVHRTVRLGYPVVEVPIQFEDRVAGASKVSQGEISRALWTVLRLSMSR